MSGLRFLVLGSGEGWHADQLRDAARSADCQIEFASYESLAAEVGHDGYHPTCEVGSLHRFDAILTRTMPAGSLEQITFRLDVLHALSGLPIVNSPRGLEIAIDKFATLARAAALGYPVPRTRVAQSRGDAMTAFTELGGDCVVKPIFGGEGRGVMRIRDPELAWYTFSTLGQLGAVCYLQEFVAPGGTDTRLLVIGKQVFGFQRTNPSDFRTNVANGGDCEPIEVTAEMDQLAIDLTQSIGLSFAAIDLIPSPSGSPYVLEVNGIPGWRGAQRVCHLNLAEQILALLCELSESSQQNQQPKEPLAGERT